MTVEIRRGSARFVTRGDGLTTRHSFSFGAHYDPDNTGFGPMVCHDDHLVAPGYGFPDHRHEGLDIVTWVVTGALVHAGAAGPPVTLGPGHLAVLSTGSGVVHSELASESAGPTRFVQAWLTPDDTAGEPSYDSRAVDLPPGALIPVVSGRGDPPDAPLAVGTTGATLYAAVLGAGQSLTLPAHELQHAFVVRGSLARSSLAEPLSAGDAFRITDRPGLELTAASPSELLVWTFERRHPCPPDTTTRSLPRS